MATYRQYPFANADHSLRSQVWNKGLIVPNNDPNVFRQDMCGSWMQWDQHGNRDHKYGWEIDHVMPQALGGGNALSNLQPLNWENNARKGDTYPWKC